MPTTQDKDQINYYTTGGNILRPDLLPLFLFTPALAKKEGTVPCLPALYVATSHPHVARPRGSTLWLLAVLRIPVHKGSSWLQRAFGTEETLPSLNKPWFSLPFWWWAHKSVFGSHWLSFGFCFSLCTNFFLILPKTVGDSPQQGMVPFEGIKENMNVGLKTLSPLAFYSFSRGVPQVTTLWHHVLCMCACVCLRIHNDRLVLMTSRKKYLSFFLCESGHPIGLNGQMSLMSPGGQVFRFTSCRVCPVWDISSCHSHSWGGSSVKPGWSQS